MPPPRPRVAVSPFAEPSITIPLPKQSRSTGAYDRGGALSWKELTRLGRDGARFARRLEEGGRRRPGELAEARDQSAVAPTQLGGERVDRGATARPTHVHAEAVASTKDGAACIPATNESRRSDRAPGSSISHGVPRLRISGTPGNGTSRRDVCFPRACSHPSGEPRRYGLRAAGGSRRATAQAACSVSCRSTSTSEAYAECSLQPRPTDDRDRGHHRRAGRHELQEALLDGDAHDVRDDHWKISVVQSPPWSRTSCARAGPSGRSWKSRKKSGSIVMPPFGSQLIRRSHERMSG